MISTFHLLCCVCLHQFEICVSISHRHSLGCMTAEREQCFAAFWSVYIKVKNGGSVPLGADVRAIITYAVIALFVIRPCFSKQTYQLSSGFIKELC